MTEKQEAYKKSLIRRLHAIKADRGMSEECYRATFEQYNATSSKELTIGQLEELIQKMGYQLDKRARSEMENDLDSWRKRVMGAIGSWLSMQGRTATAGMIKAIACRAARVNVSDFNRIERKTLVRVYNEFKKKQ